MSNAFVPLAAFLAASAAEDTAAPAVSDEVAEAAGGEAVPRDCAAAVSAARRFYAGVCDAVDAAVPSLLRSIASEVLGRELRLALVEIDAIVSSVLDRFKSQNVLSIRVHPADLNRLDAFDFDRVADRALQPGDLIIDLRSGTIDLTLEARLETILAAWG